MKEKKGGFLRWPWNVVVYVLLFAVFRLFAVPIILILMAIQRKNNPNGVAEGYCLSRTRRRLTWLLWGLLVLVAAAGLLWMLKVGLEQDRAYWETSDYVTLAFCGVGGPLLLIGGLYIAYAAVRDACFPARSALARSIRSQLPYPEEAPPVEELFAMVDGDLKANGRWFEDLGIGQEWVLGEEVNRIDRLRGIFVVDETRTRHSGSRTSVRRILQLVLVDDRWQRHVTDFKKPDELRAAADCLAFRVPEARRGTNGQWESFWTMDESAREDFERDFRQRQNRRASEAAQREILSEGPQDMILKRRDGEVTSRVTASLVEDMLKRCLWGEESGFELTPTRPVEAGGRTLRTLDCLARTEEGAEPRVLLLLELGEDDLALALETDGRRAEEILRGWLRREAPDLTDWELRRVYAPPQAAGPQARRESRAKLSLVYAGGAAENHVNFTQEDVQVAAEGIVDGTYQIVDLTHSVGYLWIRVTAGGKLDARCTVEATKPEGEELGFYIAKMPPKEAAAWLTGYPRGTFLPGGRDWKRVKKPK